jgi:signal transduction histidine kinase
VKRLSIYTRTLLTISAAILVIFLALALIYGTIYSYSSWQQRQEELKRNAIELADLTESRMDAAHTTFTSPDIKGHISFAARSTGSFVWIVNARGEIIHHTGIPLETMLLLERSGSEGRGDPILPQEARNEGHAVFCQAGDKTGFASLLEESAAWLVASAPIGVHGDLYTGEVILLKRHHAENFSAFLLEHNVPISFAAAFILSLVIIIWLSRNITRPISALAKTANAVYAGDLSARVSMEGDPGGDLAIPAGRQDDLTRLVHTFNMLIAQFEEREEQHSEFLSNVSHDLRTPVTSIGGFIEGMRDGTIAEEKYAYYLDIIKLETNRLEGLINTLFDQTGLEGQTTLKKEVFDLYSLIRQVKQSFEPMLAEKKIELETVFDHRYEEPVRAVGDTGQLTRVLNNVIANAVRFTPEKGIIIVSTAVSERSIRVSVEDNGPGIAQEDLPRIFDRFYKADKSRHGEGSGLGLYIARALIQRHSQHIEAGQSAELGGARITFTVARP